MSTSANAASADQHSQSGSSSDNTEWRLLQLPAREEELGSSPQPHRDNYNTSNTNRNTPSSIRVSIFHYFF